MFGLAKLIIIILMRMFMRIFSIFPLKNNRIIFNSYRGTQYSCNPKYISEMLLEMYPNDFEIIWAFDKPCQYRHLKEAGIKLVKFKSFTRFYYEATAKISINNIGSFSWLPRRKGQEHVNTWHSGLDLESCGMNEPVNDKLIKYTIGLSAKETSLFLSANRMFSDYSVKVQFAYNGMMLNCGLPRGDNLINGKAGTIRKNVRKHLGISNDAKVIMYAPTWRYAGVSAMPEMNYFSISEAMNERFGEDYVILNRSHHLTGNTKQFGDKHLMDMTSYEDIEELVIASDILISDYSSVIWDAALINLYIILYAPDVEQFEKERGLYVPVNKWGFPLAYSITELYTCIKSIDMEEGKKNAENLLQKMGSYETGQASKICCNWIAEKCGVNVGKNDTENTGVSRFLKHTEEKENRHMIDDF